MTGIVASRTVFRWVFRYDSANMIPLPLLAVVLGAVAMSVIGVRHVLETPAKQKRKVAYQAALPPYSEVLKPGMTRNDMESYLPAENVQFGHTCCVEPTDL